MTNAPRAILPGATIGILGSGQLGRMLALAARRMGYRVHTYSPDTDSPTGQVADSEFSGSYHDIVKVREFAQGVDVVTFEFENVPAATANACAEVTVVRPQASVLHTTQDRLREKTFLRDAGIPTAQFAPANTLPELQEAVERIGAPCVIKTAGFGYDGKGQRKISNIFECESAWHALNSTDLIVEKYIDFTHEASVVAARAITGDFAHFGLLENIHCNHILDFTIAPARLADSVAHEAVGLVKQIFAKLDVVGVMCVELFICRDGKILANELAPRPHNSGHYTIDACVTSQFEQQLRAVCGLPLGSTEQLRPAAMANLLGDLWGSGEPNWPALTALSDVKLHLYGKTSPRPGRKMGHLTALGNSADEALAKVSQARDVLTSH